MENAIDDKLEGPAEDRITVPQAASLLGIDPKVMRREIIDKGKIPFEVPSKQPRLRMQDVLDYRDRVRRKATRRRRRPVEDAISD